MTANPADALGGRLPLTDPEALTGEQRALLDSGPNVMRGYLGRPEDTARTVLDGWLHTGDIGHLDADGYLTLAGRSKDMIIRGGENIYPREIEDVLVSDPTVLEAAVIGAPRREVGRGRDRLRRAAPGRHHRPRRTAGDVCAQPRRLQASDRDRRRDAIPKNPVGKTDKAPLRAAHAAPPAPNTTQEATQ